MYYFIFQIRAESFFDTRDKSSPAIVINTMKHDRKRFLPRLYVLAVYNYSTEICVPLKMLQRSGFYKFPPQSIYVNYLWKTSGQILHVPPQHIRITTDYKCKTDLSSALKVLHNSKKNGKKKLKLGVCLHQPLYGDVTMREVIDWIVIHELMGVDIIYIYKQKVPLDFERYLKPFTNSGLVETIDWSLGVKTNTYGQRALIHDCLYRSINRVEYLAMYDVDEIFVPRNYFKWTDLMREIEQKNDMSRFAMINIKVRQWHDSGVPSISLDQTNNPCNINTLPVYFNRAFMTNTTLSYKSKSKLFLRPEAVDSCSVHTIYSFHSEKRLYGIKQHIGQVFHYRRHEHPYTALVHDTIMNRYADKVLNRLCSLQDTVGL